MLPINTYKLGEIVTLFVYMDISTEEYEYLKKKKPDVRLFQSKSHPNLILESKYVAFDNAFYVDFKVIKTTEYLR